MTDWFRHLKSIVNRRDEPAADRQALARAAAVVLLDLAAADDDQAGEELELVHAAVRDAFDLEESELAELISQADALQRQAVSLHEFTHDLRTGLSAPERAELVEWLWRVAYADGRIDRYEEHLMRRLADLLGVPHEEFIRRKHQAAWPTSR